jgi:hypothetical protein
LQLLQPRGGVDRVVVSEIVSARKDVIVKIAHGGTLGRICDFAQDGGRAGVTGDYGAEEPNLMFSLKTHAIITGGLFAAMIVMAMVGGALHDNGYIADSSNSQLAAKIIFFTLFLAFGFSAIPLMVKLVLAGQTAIGNADVGVVRHVAAHETRIVIMLWVLIGLGLAIAIPAAIHDGFFDSSPSAANGQSTR